MDQADRGAEFIRGDGQAAALGGGLAKDVDCEEERKRKRRGLVFRVFGFSGHRSPGSNSGRKGRECAGSPGRSRARTPKIRASTLERSMLSPHTRRRAVESAHGRGSGSNEVA